MTKERDRYETDLLGLLVSCPECLSGKHQNCCQTALDPISDEFVPCSCAECAR